VAAYGALITAVALGDFAENASLGLGDPASAAGRHFLQKLDMRFRHPGILRFVLPGAVRGPWPMTYGS
jgi:hypothetical protein